MEREQSSVQTERQVFLRGGTIVVRCRERRILYTQSPPHDCRDRRTIGVGQSSNLGAPVRGNCPGSATAYATQACRKGGD